MAATDSADSKREQRVLRFRVLSAASLTLLSWLSICTTIAVLPRIVANDLGAGEFSVGLIAGAYGLSSVLIRPLAGRYSDRFGPPIVGIAGSLFLLAGALMLFLPDQVGLLFASRVVAGVGLGAVIVAMLALIVSLAPDTERAYWVGFNGMAMWLAFAIGPPVAELLRLNLGYGAIWAVSAAAPVLSIAIGLTLPRAPTAVLPAPGRQPWIAREALLPGLMLALAAISVAALSGFLILHLEDHGVAHAATGLSVYGISLVLTRLVIGRLPDRYDPAACTMFSLAGQGVGLAVIAAFPTLLGSCIGSAIVGASFSLIFPSLTLIVTNRAPPERRGVAIGTYTSSLDLGMLLGAPLLGVIVSWVGFGGGFAAAALTALTGSALCLILFRPQLGRTDQAAPRYSAPDDHRATG